MADTIKLVLKELERSSMLAEREQSHYFTTKDALAEIKRIIEESKPNRVLSVDMENSRRQKAYQMAVDDYHNNLLKVLGE